jgi:hypothetical protein
MFADQLQKMVLGEMSLRLKRVESVHAWEITVELLCYLLGNTLDMVLDADALQP